MQNGQPYQRIFVVIIDSLGIGATADANHFESLGADTLGHLGEHFRVRLQLPTFQKMGLGNLHPIMGMSSLEKLHAAYGQMNSISTGLSDRESQWEMMGLATTAEPDVFIDGVPLEIATNFARKTKRPLLSNSLMNIRTALKDYGLEQFATGGLLLATASSSSVWLIAHEQTISVGELKEDCQILRKLLDNSPYTIENVNGLLFSGNQPANFYPQELYKFPLAPASPTVIDCLLEAGYAVKLIGKSTQFFGLDHNEITGNNKESFVQLQELIDKKFTGVCIAEVGKIEQFGKARNPEGFGTELMRIDHELTKIIDKLQDDDLLIVTGNFGNDPTYPGEKHTREYVPLLVTSPQIKPNISLGGRSFSDIGATILDNYDLEDKLLIGNSFLRELFSAYR
ncbi:phosphopentomutase [Limosilactobacillus reuteri]|jgi:phosphopentomutase|uniref:Phosphopentomutase n=3 Tax=Limosilactobacillus reuteri TaxID=1598 RepID=A0A1V4FN61_LIMRT|nr:phosphopentomutase [Limosilactobacillus reuteri]CCC03152.1 phosphopentomutase [Limosilactobacillus reuteri subsp. suis]AGN99989.1 phosphopentomutase [Limosilactobacillus reuteri I5007]AMY13948.1 phosphopentomutase [Limosilactobacillus reuteri]MCC4340865.1 phosphopentomutase [Limosilactobacillus reuteri]MCC4345333.1 phosphopentomutase [Limosilactobacillus reuteri]